MSIRTSPWPPGTPCWVELSTPNPAAVKDFYAGIFRWTFDDMGPDQGNYSLAKRDGHRAAGVLPAAAGMPVAWTMYIATDDVDATCAAVSANGGAVYSGPMDVGPIGRMAIVADPAGIVFGVWQHGTTFGAELTSEPGGLVWEQLMSPDFPAAQAFYAAVFGWRYEAVEGAGDAFVTFHDDTVPHPLGGLSDTMGGTAPPGWGVHLVVEDTDAAVAFTEANGGTVIRPAEDTPYGRMAVIADPAGAAIGVMTTVGPQPDRAG